MIVKKNINMICFHVKNLWSTSFFRQTSVILPLSFFLLSVMGSRWTLKDDLLFNASISGLWGTTTTATGLIAFQRFQGVLQYLALSTLPSWSVFLSLMISAALIGLVAVPISVFCTYILSLLSYQRFPDVTPNQVIGLLLAILACVASAVLLSTLFVYSRHASSFESLILVPVWMLCGIVVPTDTFPPLLKEIAFIHPLTSAVRVARFNSIVPKELIFIFLCCFLSFIYILIGAFGLKNAINHARIKGDLSLS